METHYERLTKRLKGRDRVRKLVESMAADGNNAVWKILPLLLGQAVTPEGKPLTPREYGMLAAGHLEVQRWIQKNQTYPYSFSEMMTHPDYLGILRYLLTLTTPGEVVSTLQVNYQWLCHEKAGKRVYEVSPGLAEQLRYTEIRGVRAEDLRLPYESIYIQVPKESGLKVWNVETKWHRVIGAYITEERCMNEEDAYEAQGVVGNLRGWRILMVGEDKSPDPAEPGDDALAFYRVLLKDGTKLTDIVQKAREEMDNNTRAVESTWDPRMSEDWEPQFQWCMNVILYATWQEPGEHWMANKEARQLWNRIQKTASKKKRKDLNKKFQSLDPQRRIKLGKSIIIDRKRKGGGDLPDKFQTLPREAPLMRIKTRVSGFWKNVPYGPKHSLRRYQWIEPHWRNKDGIERVQAPKHEVR